MILTSKRWGFLFTNHKNRIMRTRKYKTLKGMLRVYDKKQFTMNDFLTGREVYDRKSGKWFKIELSDEALRELSDGFCYALSCQKRKRDTVFFNMKYHKILNRRILDNLWVELWEGKPSFTYCVGQDGDTEYPLVKRILYRGY